MPGREDLLEVTSGSVYHMDQRQDFKNKNRDHQTTPVKLSLMEKLQIYEDQPSDH